MSVTSLSITKRLRESLKKAEARSIISFIVTLGFVTVTLLFALGYTTPDAFNLIMGNLLIIQFAVIGFYFTAPKGNGNGNGIDITNLRQQEMVIETLTDSMARIINALNQVTVRMVQLENVSAKETPA